MSDSAKLPLRGCTAYTKIYFMEDMFEKFNNMQQTVY